MTKKTYKLAVLGCRTNQYESEAFRSQLDEIGYTEASKDSSADVCIVNTCTVTHGADRDSRYQIRRLVRENPNAKVLVTGCFAEQNKDQILNLSEQITVVPNHSKEQLIEKVDPNLDVYPEFKIKQFEAHTRAFVKVQDGCNSFCTYCIIPYVRGRSKSRPIDEIVKEIEGLVTKGYQEIVLTGINIGDFDGNGTHTLTDLVKVVDQIPGVKRIRISSIDPDEVDDSLLQAIVDGKNTCSSMHLVLQSGSNVVLKRMNRKYTRQIFFDTVNRLVHADPNFTFTTDAIIGFPGEEEEDFRDTIDVIEKVQFAKVHMFPYSPRSRTRAASYPNQVSHALMNVRKSELLKIAENVSFRLRDRFIGKKMHVLTESKIGDNGEVFGHTENFLPVYIEDSTSLVPNKVYEVELIKNTPKGLIAKKCSV